MDAGGINAAAAAAGEGRPSSSTITVAVKFGGRTFPISLSPDSTVRELKSLLQPLTNVLPRGQKLIFKGKVLMDTMSLQSSLVMDGSKIMMLASHGLHQGDGPITKATTVSLSDCSKALDSDQHQRAKNVTAVPEDRAKHWKITGVVALSESHLKAIPDEVWNCGASVRVLDICNNLVKEIPAKIGSLESLNKLLLSTNGLADGGICWKALSSLKYLRVLSLAQNQLITLPSALGNLTSLTQLDITNNKLSALPDEVGFLKKLQILKAGKNRIHSLPLSFTNCISLIEIDLSSNLLIQLPETFGDLKYLKVLLLRNNGLCSLPSTLFKMCSQLSTLDLHGTELTNDVLREVEGWQEFDERRRSKHQKQLDFHVGSSGSFDEGADDDWKQ